MVLSVEINALWYNAVCFTLELASSKDKAFIKNGVSYKTSLVHLWAKKDIWAIIAFRNLIGQ